MWLRIGLKTGEQAYWAVQICTWVYMSLRSASSKSELSSRERRDFSSTIGTDRFRTNVLEARCRGARETVAGRRNTRSIETVI
eukprot:564163-Amorphochlora_amoeboformis.AAC.2